MAVPTILDSLLLTNHTWAGTSDTFSYTVPAGSNRVFILLAGGNGGFVTSADLNGSALTLTNIDNTSLTNYTMGYLVNPSTGTFNINITASTVGVYYVLTLDGAAQTSPIDVTGFGKASATSVSKSVTTTADEDILLSFCWFGITKNFVSFSAPETSIYSNSNAAFAAKMVGSWMPTTTAGSYTMTTTVDASGTMDETVIAVKAAAGGAATVVSSTLPYLGAG